MSGCRRFKAKRKCPSGKSGADKTAVRSAMDCAWSQDGIDARKARAMKKGKEHKGRKRKET
jgi:hypothetical protein